MFNLWLYRINVGWWLEEAGYDNMEDASASGIEKVEKHVAEHPNARGKMAFAVGPAGDDFAFTAFGGPDRDRT